MALRNIGFLFSRYYVWCISMGLIFGSSIENFLKTLVLLMVAKVLTSISSSIAFYRRLLADNTFGIINIRDSFRLN